MAESRRTFVERLFAQHGRALQAYIHRKIRTKYDAADLAQEVYVRMLRIKDIDAIRNPQVYLYAIASNLVKEHALRDQRLRGPPEIHTQSDEQRLGELASLDSQLDATQTVERLRTVIDRLPARWRLAVMLHYRYDLTYREIGDRLGVSSNMIKKYLAQGLGQCRRQLAQRE